MTCEQRQEEERQEAAGLLGGCSCRGVASTRGCKGPARSSGVLGVRAAQGLRAVVKMVAFIPSERGLGKHDRIRLTLQHHFGCCDWITGAGAKAGRLIKRDRNAALSS